MKIQSIIFDLGGVLLNIKPDLTLKAFKKNSIIHIEHIYKQCKQQELFDKFETGKINAKQFRTAFKKHLTHRISSATINQAWNAMLLDLPKEKIDILTVLYQKYNLFLLSNTNPIHLDAFKAIVKKEYGKNTFFPLFKKEYYSHQIGLRKPDRKIFELVLNENSLLPSETLFVDDTLEHIEAAKQIGIHTFWLNENRNFSDILLLLGERQILT